MTNTTKRIIVIVLSPVFLVLFIAFYLVEGVRGLGPTIWKAAGMFVDGVERGIEKSRGGVS